MILWKYRLRSLFLAALLTAIGRSAYAQNAVVGVNLVNEPYKLTVPEQESILSEMERDGVQVIRAGIPASGDSGVSFAQRVNAYGIKIELLLGIVPVSGTPWPQEPTGFKGLWRGYPLSTADPERFREYFAPLLARLEDKGIVLAAIELGNEINWAGFNADFTLPGQGRLLQSDDLINDPEGKQVALGYLRYLKTMAVLKDIRDHSRLNQHTPIISAGLADLDDSTWTHQTHADSVNVSATLDFLRTNGLDKLVDGYGIHNYPKQPTAEKRRAHIENNGMAEFQPAGSPSGKPCWVTEWGVNGASATCPVDDSARIPLVREVRGYYNALAKAGRLRGMFFYTWEGNIHAAKEDSASAFRCGALTESGRLAIAPL